MADQVQIPQLINISQLAQRLGVPRRTLHYWLTHNTLPIAPVPGMKPAKWRKADVDAFVAARDA